MKKPQKLDYLKTPLRTLWYTLYPYRWKFFVMLVMIILGDICSYITPYFLKLIADKVMVSGGIVSLADLNWPFILLAGALIFQEVFLRLGHIIETYIVPDAFEHITKSLYEGLIKRPTSYFENKFSGDLGRRIEQVGTSTNFFLESFPWELGWMVMSIIMSAIILAFTHTYVLWTFIAWTCFFIGSSIPLLIWHSKASEKVASAHAVLSGSIVDTLGNISLVQSFGGSSHEQRRNQSVVSDVVTVERRMRWISIVNKFQNGVSVAVLGISLTYVSILLFSRGQFTVGDFIIVAATIPTLSGVIWGFGDMIMRVSRNFGSLSDAVMHLREKQEQLLGGSTDGVAGEDYSIEFKDVFFQYQETESPVFEKFSMQIRQGEKVGLVGTSGAGKSTLVKLLLRQHEFSGGDVRIGDVSIRDFSLEAFNKLISYVPQDTSLFHRTLLENIKYAKTDATDEEVIEASTKANADEFISTFPQGYDTKVGERGVKLSGGQRQRIALARAILKNAPILILDEATSSLDSESESFIQAALSELFKDHTVIAIAHRLSTLKAMDRIIVLENGLVVESGNPQDLIAKEGSIFKKMWEHQKDGFIS